MKFIYSILSISNVIGALITGKRAHKMHNRNGIALCMLVIAINIVVIGLIDLAAKNSNFLGWAALFLRSV